MDRKLRIAMHVFSGLMTLVILITVELLVPKWTLIVIFAIVGLSTWFTYFRQDSVTRFSLRDLLIATTLVAVALGLGAWLAS